MAFGKLIKDGKTIASVSGTLPYVAEAIAMDVRNMILDEGHNKFEVVIKEENKK